LSTTALRVLIVDDEALAAERLGRLCGRLDGVEIVGSAADGRTALAGIEAFDPDLVLLDISMPGMDGMALARVLTTHEHRPAVVFVTAHSSYAVAAFELAATDYLLKPVSLPRLHQAIKRVKAGRQSVIVAPAHLSEIWAPRGREMIRLGVETLDLLEAERDYVRLHARGHSYLFRATLHELERRLDPDHFLRVHRSTIVPLDRVRGFERGLNGGWAVLLSTGSSVKVGRSFQSVVRKLTAGLA